MRRIFLDYNLQGPGSVTLTCILIYTLSSLCWTHNAIWIVASWPGCAALNIEHVLMFFWISMLLRRFVLRYLNSLLIVFLSWCLIIDGRYLSTEPWNIWKGDLIEMKDKAFIERKDAVNTNQFTSTSLRGESKYTLSSIFVELKY